MHPGLRRSLIFGAILSTIGSVCWSQTYYGTIVGTVSDSSGAAFPNAEVTLTNVATNISVKFISNEVGNYRAPNLIPGTYRVSVEQPGFKRFVAEDIDLSSMAERRVDVRLEIGAVTESITVTGGAQLVETEKATFSDVKSNYVFTNMPVNSNYRSIWRMLDLTPGANYSTGSNYAGNGMGRNTTYTIDGIKVMDGWTGNSFGPSLTYMDSYREFRFDLVSANASAPTSANISVVSESGTNDIHGEAWLHYNAVGFTARPFFAPTRPHGPPIFRPNVKVGGPAYIPKLYNGKDRTFVHFSWQALRGSQAPYVANFVTPLPAFRQGDFSSLPGTLMDPLSNTPFPNKQIPANRVSPVSQYYQDTFYPMPNTGDRFNGIFVFPNSSNQYTGRTDHKISDANSFFVRFQHQTYSYTRYDGDTNPMIGIFDQWRDQYIFGISDTHVFSPTLINELRLGYSRDDSIYGGERRGLDIVRASGLALRDLEDVRALPRMNVTGFSSIYQGDQNGWTWSNYHITENVLWTKGKHNFRFGVDRDRFNGRQYATSPSRVFGEFSFNGRFTGNPYGDFLLGLMDTSARSTSVGRVYPHRTNWEFYFTDDFKVTPRLSLNYGVRYSLLDPGRIEQDLIANFVPAVNALVVPNETARSRVHPGFPSRVPIVTASSAGLGEKLLARDMNNVAPRFGFAWRPTTSDTFVIRGGGGVYNVAMQPYISDGGGAPYELRETFTNAITDGQPAFSFPNPFPSTTYVLGGTGATGMNTHLRTPYSVQYNLTAEKEVWDMGLSFTYMSTMARKTTWSRDLNQVAADTRPYTEKLAQVPFPYLFNVNFIDNGGSHNYHGGVIKAERKLKDGFYYQAHLTMAKSVGDNWSGGVSTAEDAFNRTRERSQGGAIPRWRGVVVGIYELPFGRGKKFAGGAPGVVNHVVGNWMVAGTYVYRTGTFFTPSYAGVDASNTNRRSGRPDRIGDGNLPGDQRTLERWFDTSAFVFPPEGAGRFGTSGNHVLQGPSMSVFHFGATKEIPLHERARLKLEMVSTNFFNHPNFANPNAVVGTSPFGRVLSTISTDGNRDFQLTARLTF
ncbi:MAG: TonB-dependent receptor [Bryobacteraceae bacterium]|nr:TonB-dependent receptor [Bryobacteraceae bacterium]